MGDKDGGYNPYEHREVERPVSNFGAFVQLLKCIIGTGILSLPFAYTFAGVIGGTILTTACIILTTYGSHLLVGSMTEAARRSQRPYTPYPDAIEICFAEGPKCFKYMSKASSVLVNISLVLAHYGVLVIYIIFVAKNLLAVMYQYDAGIPEWLMKAIIGSLELPLYLIRHLKYLVPSTIVATGVMYLAFIFIFVYLFQGLPPLSDVDMFVSPSFLPLFLGIVFFAVVSVGGVLAVESKMKHPEKFLGWKGVLNMANIFSVLTNTLFGILGYWRYQQNVEEIVTLNLPIDEGLSQAAKIMFAISVFFTFPLAGFIIIDVLMNQYILRYSQPKHPHLIEYIIRASFVIIATINAIVFPNIAPLVALVGALTMTVLILVFPGFMDICLLHSGSGYGIIAWKLIRDIIVIIIGFIVMIYGSYKAIENIIYTYTEGDGVGEIKLISITM